MLQHLAVDEPIERGHQDLAQADQRVDAEDHRRAALQAVDGADRDVGAPLELGLAPASGFSKDADPPANVASDLTVALPQETVRPPRATFTLLRRHSPQARHWSFPEQEGRVFSPRV